MKPEQGELFVANRGKQDEFKILWREVEEEEEGGNLLGFVPKAAFLLASFHQATGIGGDWSG